MIDETNPLWAGNLPGMEFDDTTFEEEGGTLYFADLSATATAVPTLDTTTSAFSAEFSVVAASAPSLVKTPSRVMKVFDYVGYVKEKGPRALYELQDVIGATSIKDSSGNGLDLTSFVGTPQFQVPSGPGTGRTSIVFGQDFYAGRGVVSTVVDNLTMVLWIAPFSVTTSFHWVLFNGDGSTNGWGIEIGQSTMKIRYTAYNVGQGSDSVTALTPFAWNQVVVTRDNGVWKYYVNRSLDTANAGTHAPNTPNTHFYLGDPTTPSIAVLLAYAAVYEKVFSQVDVNTDYDSMVDNLGTHLVPSVLKTQYRTLTRTPSAAVATLKRTPSRILSAVSGASVATLDALDVTVVALTTTAGHVTSLLRAPSKKFLVSRPASVVLRKTPQKIFTIVSATVPRVATLQMKTLATTLTHAMLLVLHRCGVSPLTYRLNCERNWTATYHASKWSVDGFARFTITPGEIFGCD